MLETHRRLKTAITVEKEVVENNITHETTSAQRQETHVQGRPAERERALCVSQLVWGVKGEAPDVMT